MKRLPPGPVPPLGDAAMQRIERGVFAALDARAPEAAPRREVRRRVVALSVAGAVAAMAILGVREGRRGDGSSTRTAKVTTTTSGSRIAIQGAALEIAPESAVSFGAGKDGAMVVVLDRGAVTCEVAPRTNRAPFIVEAGATRVTVIGTRFTVRRVGEHASVSVEHGLVEVADTNMTELVHAGERFQPGQPLSREPLATEAPAPAVAPAPVVASAPVVVAAAARALPRRSHEPRLAVPVAPEPGPAPVASPALGSGVVAPVVAAAPAAAPVLPVAGPPKSARSVQVLFELAAQLEVRDPTTALGIYSEISAGDDAWAASALLASARLEAERGQTHGARSLCEAYLRRFPNAPNAADARELLSALP